MKDVTDELPFEQVFAQYEIDNPKVKESNHVDPRFRGRPTPQGKDEDGYEIYKALKAKGKI